MKNLVGKQNRGFTRLKFQRKFKGFTIIEVMIVLAIAGLILSIVFIAVPQLQRNTRDNRRQNLVSRLKSEIESYAGNNQGRYPFSSVPSSYQLCSSLSNYTGATNGCQDWLNRYITGATPPVDITDPSTGNPTSINISTSSATITWAQGNVWISVGNRCNGESVQAGSGGGSNARSYALVIALDRSNTFYCVDNG